MNLTILTLTKKNIKKAAIYRPYDHLQASGFTFENKSKKETFKVKLAEKLDFIDQTYSSKASKYNLKKIMNIETGTWCLYGKVKDSIEVMPPALQKCVMIN